MRRFIFWTLLFLRFNSVFCVITISITGPVLVNVPHPVTWTREDTDLEVLPIFRIHPGEADGALSPVVVVDTLSQLSGTVDVPFDSAAPNRQLVIKDPQSNVIAQTQVFSVLDPDVTDDSSSSSQNTSTEVSDASQNTSTEASDGAQNTSTVASNGVQRTSSSKRGNAKNILENPAVLGSVIAAGAVVIIIFVMLLFFYWRLRRRRDREAFLRTQTNGYGEESSQVRFTDAQRQNVVVPPRRPIRRDDLEDDLYHVPRPDITLQQPSSPAGSVNPAAGRGHSRRGQNVVVPPRRPIRRDDPEDDLYYVPPPDVVLQQPSSPTWSVNRTAGRVHSHQASLTLVSPSITINSSLPELNSHGDRDDQFTLESPTMISPASSYNSTSSLLHQASDVFHNPLHDSRTLPTPVTASPSVLLHPPPRSGSMDSKRYLAFVEAQRERARSDRAMRAGRNGINGRRSPQENPEEWRTSWQEVSDPPPSYPGHSNL